ncbi:GroES-like protein [Cylindrobasidium torrendii FP15055 ss-10]|uniref:GroES-like protein n=1 Tax=Cylindrobasidium torrendii FP15055 ss-10 TaxID=1314674 RepID=A0A0D7BEU9_9AGAR|nr:GroES-like protein [Cylindrobasidium torrendii FP15055 ss-10]
MASTSTALVLHGAKDLRLENRDIDAPPADHVQINVLATGLCGSDLHYYTHNCNGAFAVQSPMVLGHESAGIITAVGPGVTHVSVGQKVAIEAGVACANCDYCQKDRYNLCAGMSFRSSAKTFPHADGTMQTLINQPAKLAHVLPENVTVEMGALVEPLSVLIHASRRAALGSTPGQRVIIFGAGAIGLLAASTALGKGVKLGDVVMVDINQERLDFAKEHGFAGAVHCLEPKRLTGVEGLDHSKKVAEQWGSEFDVAFECTGVESCMQMAIYSARTGGKVMLIGMGTPNAFLPISNAAVREVDILGSFRYANTYPEAIQMFADGKLSGITDIITHRIPLEKDGVSKAFEAMAKGKDEDGKLVIKVIVGSA